MVTDEQVQLLRKQRMEGKSQATAAAVAGMSERTARQWERGALPSQTRTPRPWRTRRDPFEQVWDEVVVPLLEADADRKLQATTVFDELVERFPDRFESGQLRTLQRRMRKWRALHGPDQDVVFEQEHPPGREAAFDFTDASSLGITVAGEAMPHLVFTWRLSCSRWTFAQVAFSETWEALSRGVQAAVWALGGVPQVLRHDNLSAATRDLRKGRGRGLTVRFESLLSHYGLTSTRIRPGKSQENGGAEKTNDLVKTALDQALRLRASREFATLAEYERFLQGIVDRLNRRHESAIEKERASLRPLPDSKLPDHTTYEVRVRRWSTICIRGCRYSVPSRLIGHQVVVHLHPDRLEVYSHNLLTATLARLRGKNQVAIDYRHIIWSLVRKPGAFARYRYREELFPTLPFRQAYDALVTWRGERADIEYVRILHLAASTMQAPVERALVDLLAQGRRFDYVAVKALVAPQPISIPHIQIGQPDLRSYDLLIGRRP